MKKIIWIVVIAVVLGGGYFFLDKGRMTEDNTAIKIGIITDLSGGAAYWGESTKAGADILQKELAVQRKSVEFIFEDYGLDSAKAASAAQKLLSVDKVNAVYAEFNPGSIAAASVLKDKNIPMVYDAAIISPLSDSALFYKTYLNYEEGCRQIAEKFKTDGVEKLAFLKVNLEFGNLCENGIKQVYGNDIVSEGYNLGDTDFRTQLLKIKTAGASAVINVGFEGDTANTLKIIKDFKYSLRYGTVDDTITKTVLATYASELKGGWTFGFENPPEDFQNKLKSYIVTSPYGAAFAYTHLRQLVNALALCQKDVTCISQSLDQSPSDATIGFQKYTNRIAEVKMKITQY